MRKNKMGSLFLISVLALAGIGISYAGWTDTITVTGTVSTGDVDIDVVAFSGTWIWKTISDHGLEWNHYIYNPGDLVYNLDTDPDADDHLHQGWYNDPEYLEVACAWAEPSDNIDETGDDDGVDLFFKNLFPCQDFTVDFILHYVGSIPARLNGPILIDTNDGATGELPENFKGNSDGYDWLEYLWYVESLDGYANGGIGYAAYRCEPSDNGWIIHEDEPIDIGSQFEDCNYIYVKLIIHIPQDNDYQNLVGGFTTAFEVIQWDEYTD